MRYCGHIALVKVQASEEIGTGLACESSIMHNHTECGANALNINRCAFSLVMFGHVILLHFVF